MASFRFNCTPALGTRPRHILDESAFNVQSPEQQLQQPAEQAAQKRQTRTPSPMLPPKRARLEAAIVHAPTPDLLFGDSTPSGNLIDVLMGRGGKIGDLTEQCEKLEQQVQQLEERLQQELQAKNEETSKLQQELLQFKALNTAQASSSQRDSDTLTTVLKAHVEKNTHLQAQLAEVKARMDKMDETIAQQRQEITNLKQDVASKNVQLQKQKQEAKQELATQKQASQDVTTKLEQALHLQKKATAAERARAKDLQDCYDNAVQKCASLTDTQSQLKAELAKMEAEQLLSKAAVCTSPSVKTYELQIEVLQDQLNEKEQQLKQVDTWKEQATQYMVAQEGLRIAQQRCEYLKEKLEAANKTVAQKDELQAQLTAWSQAGQAHKIIKPEDLANVIDCLKREKEMVIKQAETLRAELHKAQQEQHTKAEVTTQASDEVEQLQQLLTASKEAQAAAERRARILQEERDGLRRLVASYQDTDEPGAAQAAQEKTEQVAELQEQVDSMLTQLQTAAATERDLQRQLTAAVSQKDALESEKQALEKELDRYAEENEKLVARVGRGEFDTTKTKVLSFKFNPEAQAREKELLKLQAEVAALRDQLSRTEGSTDSAGTVPLAEKQAEIVLLQRQVAATEKQMSRLKEVFNVRISAFREACYALFGYRIDMISQPTTMQEAGTATSTFVLQPHLASDPNAVLKFVYTKQRGMEMVPTTFSQKNQQQADIYIKRFKSIPAFTANLTLENFQKATAG